MRASRVAVALGALLLAPGAWAVQTLGHATSGTFPAGGPATRAAAGGPGGGGGAGGRGGPRRRTPAAAGGPTAARRRSAGGGTGAGGAAAAAACSAATAQSLTAALAYAKAHGGGTIAVSSQSGAASR